MPTPLRIAFAGTPEFAVPALAALVRAHHEVAGVWTQPDRPAGRGRKLSASAVKRAALELGAPLHQPGTLKSVEAQAKIKATAPDVIVVAAYGLLLPPAVLAIPKYGCINIHASLLPRWRGAAPIQRAILAGDVETGVSIMCMQAALDTGPVYAARATPIAADDTAGSVHDRLAQLGAQLLLEVLSQLPHLIPVAQDESRATYAAKLAREEARMDWALPATELALWVRAYNPWPVAYTHWQGEPLRIWSAQKTPASASVKPGTIFEASRDGIDVMTGGGVLRIVELQAAGGRRMPAADFAHARALVGRCFD